MPETLADKDTGWLARFVQDIIAQAPVTQVSYLGADALAANEILQVLDQLEISTAAFEYLRKNFFGGPGLYVGTGSPNSVVVASPGSLYVNKSGGATTTLYVKESGTGNTGWVAK